MADYQPPQSSDLTPFTMTAGATIVGGTLVAPSAGVDATVITAVTGDRPIGVAAQDAVSGQRFSVWPLSGAIHEITVEGVLTLAAKNTVIPGATGFIKAGAGLAADAAAGTLIGMCTRGGTGGTGTGKARFMGV